MGAIAQFRTYQGHTITRCGISWYVDRPRNSLSGGYFCTTLVQAKLHIRNLNAIERVKRDHGVSDGSS